MSMAQIDAFLALAGAGAEIAPADRPPVIFDPLQIPGAWLVRMEPNADERGFFARIWCHDEFAAHGIEEPMVQASVSFNRKAGTLRGMHFAWPPALEGKLVRCTLGRVYDVLLDLRPDSPMFGNHVGITLDQVEHNAVYVPPGVAHGFLTLVDDTEVYYMMNETYRPDLGGGVRHDDLAFAISWPAPITVIAERDRTYPDANLSTIRSRMSRQV